ncbi:MAG: four helix bundle protein [Ignavibacteriae bacterium]|nr:four helix bundle protein [Ignavibacteriota bacterium]
MTPDEMKTRTKKFALNVIKLVETLPNGRTGDVLGRQLIRCATSVGAYYRSACKARSKADFISKITVVKEEADESQFWHELIIGSNLLKESVVLPLLNEAKELTAIFTASGKTAKWGK